ncbi:TonB-dependent receptor domain-containing protein [Pedomonas mirosovicensis]|uniref:TonB-dependent receptor domain-containing protein n=1 Tax=Pedomonas mirosovicensis TaxID=2908641 RepID=UPI00216A84B3|nr:TonB-dependent receptor [Pedomonas mirosovicensis]MCH8683743.1 TonB-dependent receptor [Pedomonas mirosovicensis]
MIQPRFLPRFTLTVDYYNITINDYIGGSGPGTVNIIAACYGDAASDFVPYDSSFCALAPRNPNDLSLEDVVSINANLGKMKTSGVDFEARYWVNVPFGIDNDGRLDFRLSGTRLIEWKLNPIATASGLVSDCAGRFGTSCGDPLSKWRWSGRVNYSTGPFTTSLLWYHLGGAKDDDDGSLYWKEKVGSYDIFNLSFAYEVNENLDLGLGVNNLFNKKPPLFGDNQQQANTYPSTYDPFGRQYFFSATAKF